jgi:hypothetical protein
MIGSETGAVSQEPPRSKTCEACGAVFFCGTAFSRSEAGGPCWCDSVKLDTAVLTDLRAKFTDCLCPQCLQQRSGGS